MYKLEAYSDRVIVKKILLEAKSKGGIILSSQETDEDRDVAWGRALYVGEGKVIDNTGPLPMKTKVGDIVAFNERMPMRFHYKGEYFYILRETDILLRNKDEDVVEKPFENTTPMGNKAKMLA